MSRIRGRVPAGGDRGGNRITQISDFEWKKYGRLIQSQMARGVRNDVRHQLKALKRVMETSR